MSEELNWKAVCNRNQSLKVVGKTTTKRNA